MSLFQQKQEVTRLHAKKERHQKLSLELAKPMLVLRQTGGQQPPESLERLR